MSLTSIITSADPLMIAAAVATIAAYAVAVSKMLNRITEKREIEEKHFIKALSSGIKAKVVTEFSDIENIYKGVRTTTGDAEVNRARLAKWLRKYLLQLFEQDTNESEIESLKSIKKEITEYINLVEKTSPHVGLPSLERSIIRDLETYLGTDNKEGVGRKISELVAAIQVREESLQKIESTNKWAVPLSIIGLILTVVFGAISLFTTNA